jgi:hypothetical protein
MYIKTLKLTVLLSLCAMPPFAFSQNSKPAHDHAHEHHGPEAALTLDQGKKWATDAPLREGMIKIRSITTEASAKPNTKDNQLAASRIQGEIQNMFKACKLSPKADANLHLILAEMLKGAGSLKDPKAPAGEAYDKIKKALALYGQYFDHPGWTP